MPLCLLILVFHVYCDLYNYFHVLSLLSLDVPNHPLFGRNFLLNFFNKFSMQFDCILVPFPILWILELGFMIKLSSHWFLENYGHIRLVIFSFIAVWLCIISWTGPNRPNLQPHMFFLLLGQGYWQCFSLCFYFTYLKNIHLQFSNSIFYFQNLIFLPKFLSMMPTVFLSNRTDSFVLFVCLLSPPSDYWSLLNISFEVSVWAFNYFGIFELGSLGVGIF